MSQKQSICDECGIECVCTVTCDRYGEDRELCQMCWDDEYEEYLHFDVKDNSVVEEESND